MRADLEKIGLPAGYVTAVQGHRDALNTYRLSNRLWTYISPAEYVFPGERTGRFRLGGDQPVMDANGEAASPTRTSQSRSSTRPNCPGMYSAGSPSVTEARRRAGR